MCDQHFPVASFTHGVNTLGDAAIFYLSQRILDDPPPEVDSLLSDQQGGKKSIVIIYHLQQKMEAHNKYIQFLLDVGLLDRITCTVHHGKQIPTRMLLCEHGELLQAAITLRKQQNKYVSSYAHIIIRCTFTFLK